MVEIRKYISADYTDLFHLLNAVYGSNISQEVLEENYVNGNRMILVAEDREKEKIVGCVFTERQMDYVRPYQMMYVTYFAVDDTCRGQGIGRKLMEAVEHLCRKMNCTAIELTSANYRTSAHSFYHGMGYSQKKTTHFIKEIGKT